MCSQKIANYIALIIFFLNMSLIFAVISTYRSDYDVFEKFLIDRADKFDLIFEKLVDFEETRTLGVVRSESDFFSHLYSDIRSDLSY